MSEKEIGTGLGLAEVIAKVKQDLLDPQFLASDSTPLFFVDQVEIELAVKISKDAKAGLQIYVLEMGGEVAKENTQTVTITLSSILSKEEILGQISPSEQEQLKRMVTKYVVRGLSKVIGPNDI